MKMKHMLYGLLLVCTILPVCLFGIFMIWENDRKVEAIVKDDLAAISGSQILDINDFCIARQQELMRLTEYTMVKNAVLESTGGTAEQSGQAVGYLKDMLTTIIQHSTCLERISVLDREFRLVAATDGDAIAGEDALKAADVRYEDGGFAIGNVYERSTLQGDMRLLAAVAGIHDGGELIGYIVEEIPATYFDRVRQEANLWTAGTLYLLDGNGALITAGTPQEKSRVQLATSESERENFTKAWQAVDHDKVKAGVISYEMGGDEYLTYFSDLDYTDWGIRLSVNLSAYKSRINTYAAFVIIVALCLIAVLAVATWLLSRHLTKPVGRIAKTLDEVQEQQNYSLRVPETGSDEMGFLGKKVNKMLDYIELERYEVQQAERDPLTGMRNQRAVERDIQEAVARAAQNQTRIAVGFVDVDDFREINNQYGHMEGDSCIRYAASVLEEMDFSILGRSSGDAFAFCIEDVENTEAVRKTAALALEKLNEGYFSRIANKQMALPCSIGIAVDRGSHLSFNSLTHQASEALYQAKDKGKNTYHLVSREEVGGNLFGSNERVLELLRSLRQSVANDCAGFYLVYQPLVRGEDGAVVGAESLLRWCWEPFGEVSPGVFIPLIEDDSCFFKLGNWILRRSLEETMPTVKENPDFRLHVNVAYSQLVRHEFRDAVMEILRETGFPVRNLCLELTERCRALDISYLQEVMTFFHSQGVSIALDDFGTGFSSLNLLRKLPVDSIKVDKSFVTNVNINDADQAIVRSVIQCARSLNIGVCAEGVETEQSRGYLLQYPELVHQGFFYSRPIRYQQFAEYADAHRAA